MTHCATLDLDFVRSQFPGLQSPWAFMDNAGGTQILESAVQRMNEFLFHRNVQIGGAAQLVSNFYSNATVAGALVSQAVEK